VTSIPTNPASRTRLALTITAIVVAVLVVLFITFSGLYADVLWYDQLGFVDVLRTEWVTVALTFLAAFFAMALPVWISVEIAFRARPVYAKLNSQLDRYQEVIEPLRRLAMLGIPAALGLFAGASTTSQWQLVLQYFNRTPFGTVDPQFGLDVSFYVFELPFYTWVVGFAQIVLGLALAATVATAYLYGAIRVVGRDLRVSRSARVHIAILAALFILSQGAGLWLDQYSTLVRDSAGFLTTGAGYAEANALIPGRAILAAIAAFVALLFIVTAVIGRWRISVIGTALLIVSGVLVGGIYPSIIQTFQVRPSERVLESEYIDRSIAATREAYGVADVVDQAYEAKTTTAAGALREDADTTASIRILDPALVTDAFAQLERFKQYYQFPKHLDVDRYTIDGVSQDTVLAVRELNQAGLSDKSTWYNSALVYTHGYGVVAAYGTQRAVDGKPKFLEAGIPSSGALGDFEPRIYFGENSPEYSIVGASSAAKAVELDYPSTSDEGPSNTTTTFAGNGGPTLDGLLKRVVYAIKFQSQEILLSSDVSDKSQILYDRSPLDRVKKVAPYLTLDNDPYPAIVDGKILWIIDGYTTTANYPYSQVEQLSSAIGDTYTPTPIYALDDINYIRNSVKATVDAYDGSVTLYAWDTNDPILQTWQKVFPTALEPQSAMSDDLLAHVRYPADLFKMQRTILGSYHVTNSSTFYSGDDQWETPKDPTSPAANATLQPPYYLTMRLPNEEKSAFTLYSTYIPKANANSTSNNLQGYLAVNADAGPDYGKLTLLSLPGDVTVSGPGQVENAFNSNADVTTYLNPTKVGNTTEVHLGNLLTLPVGGGFLYVQPVYLQSTGETSFPVLNKVLVSFGDKIAFEDTLDAALNSLFGGDSGASAGDGGTDVPNPDPTATPGDGTTTPPTTGGEMSAALQQALADAKAALDEREAAYAKNDLVAAAEADKKLQAALLKAYAESTK
jgi:uncharacterized protein